MSGREAINFVRTLNALEVRRLHDSPDSSATLKLVCRACLAPGGEWEELLKAAGIGQVARKPGAGGLRAGAFGRP